MRANQLRLYLSAAAYVLVEALRRIGLKGTEMAQAQVNTIRLRLLKIGAQIRFSVRRVMVSMASGYPYQPVFVHAWRSYAAERGQDEIKTFLADAVATSRRVDTYGVKSRNSALRTLMESRAIARTRDRLSKNVPALLRRPRHLCSRPAVRRKLRTCETSGLEDDLFDVAAGSPASDWAGRWKRQPSGARKDTATSRLDNAALPHLPMIPAPRSFGLGTDYPDNRL